MGGTGTGTWTGTWIGTWIGLGLALGLVGCSAPEERDIGFDRMEFVDDSALEGGDDGIADSALEPIPRVRVPVRPRGVGRHGLPDVNLPAAVCANDGDRSGPARSLGSVTSGSLENGCRLPPSGPGYRSTNKNGFGTDETIALLQRCGQVLAQQFPGTAPLIIGGVSKQEGGFYPPHKSHQSGRDVDIGYPLTIRGGAKHFVPTDSGNVDTERLWAVLETLLATGKLAFVFMDYELQALLYDDLLAVGYKEEQLEPLFQYPAGPTVPRGLIRHAAGHADHFHIRFRCPDGDKPMCQD